VNSEERARFEAISEALARLVRRQEDFDRRLARLETGGVALPQIEPEPPPAAPIEPPPLVAVAPPEAPASNMETTVGLTWISRIAAVTVVLALAFFFEYAFENRWITETGRVLIGLACGAVALVFGERFWRVGQRVYGQSLAAAGIAFLYLSVWAAFGPYQLIGSTAGFGLMALATAAAGLLALRYDSAVVAMLGLAGGFATPWLLPSTQPPWFILGYALLLDAGAVFAARARRWLRLEALALAGTVILYNGQLPAPEDWRFVFTLFALLYYTLFATSVSALVVVEAQALAGLAMFAIWRSDFTSMSLAWLLAAAGLAVADRRGWSTAAPASFGGFWLAYAMWSVTVWRHPVSLTLGLLSGAFLLFLSWPVWLVHRRRRPLGAQDLLLVALNAALYFGAAYTLLENKWGAYEGLFAVAVAVVQMVAARLLWRYDARGALLAAGAAWVLLVLAAPIQFAGYRVTIAWAVEGAAVVWIGVRLRDSGATAPLRPGALCIFLLVLGRLALVDSRMFPSAGAYPLILNARLLAFAVAAVALWASAWWIGDGRPALAAYACGHAVLLCGLMLEAAGWAARTAAPENFQSAASTAISILAAAYAVLLVAGGAARRHVVTRVLGMGLIGLVILKLYLYDVWLLGQFYRMAAFAILGVLLLAMSYLYTGAGVGGQGRAAGKGGWLRSRFLK
jgi:uncharacterized membrane protein